MKKTKRILAFVIASLMIFSLIGCGKKSNNNTTEADTTEATTEETTVDSNKPTEITLNFHYLRDDGVYDGWNVWLWIDGGDGAAYEFGSDADENGVMTTATFPAGTVKLGYIVRLNEWESKDIEDDQFIELTGVVAGTVDVYVKSGVAGCEIELGDDCVTGLSVKSAKMSSDYKSIEVELTDVLGDENVLQVLDKSGAEVETSDISADGKTLTITLAEEADKFGSYSVAVDGVAIEVDMPDFYSSNDFEDEYTYDGDDLGATWSKKSTTFKVWAPTATAVTVKTYESGTKGTDDLIKEYEMKSEDKGVWSVTADGDLNGVYYTFYVDFGTSQVEACDPYAKAAGVNGDRAMVIDLDSTDPDGWEDDSNPNADLNSTDASIYEVHIRDLSSDSSSGITNVGKYLEFTEKGTTNSTGQATGLDHILELGVTHVQIGPAYDYATVDETKLDTAQYNWGYDPKNYNVPEGSYSTDPYNGATRVTEFKEMVKSLHDNGLSVVMDVVYNHTYSTDYCYNQIVPDYFYRPGSNGSGCGNDVASERAMVKKFIVDSVAYWTSEYHIDGFRFDLVGILDVDTMNEIREEVDKIAPGVILYGEGWSLSTTPTRSAVLATQVNCNKIDGMAMFDDTLRDAIKGSVFNSTEKGFVNGDTSKTKTVADAITGKLSWSLKGKMEIQYACCHDNMTLWDEICTSNADDSLEDRIAQNLMSAAIVYTSQGTPFILAGEEMLRTKTNDDGTFNSNSYNASDSVNSLKWDTLNDANYQTVFNYYKGLISFRKAHASLRMMEDGQKYYTFNDDVADGVIAYELSGVDGEVSDSIYAIYNASGSAQTITLPEGNWTICVQGTTAGTESLGTASGSITVDNYSTTILVKGALK